MCNSKNSCKKVPFEVVTIYANDIYRPYTITPVSRDSTKVYAIKIGTDYFILGEAGRGVHICDLPQDQSTPDDEKHRRFEIMSEVAHYWPEEIVGTGELVVYARDYERLREALASAEKNERHRNNSETRYWCGQYKQLARAALAACTGQEVEK